MANTFYIQLNEEECGVIFEILSLDFINAGNGKVMKQYKVIPSDEAEGIMTVLNLIVDDELFMEDHNYKFTDRDLYLTREEYQLLSLEVFYRLKKNVGSIPFRWMQVLKTIGEKLTQWEDELDSDVGEVSEGDIKMAKEIEEMVEAKSEEEATEESTVQQ